MIYADHAATTALSAVAINAMKPYIESMYGNPSTLYSLARNPRRAVSAARGTIAKAIGAKGHEVFFTGCGTESDNWALKGVAIKHHGGRIITSAIEHHAILSPCAFLQRIGYEVVYLPTDEKGIVSVEALDKAITEDTILVSIMLANNEIGTIEPIQDLASVAHQHGILFHTDAVQAVGHIPVNVDKLGVDMLSASAHKFNGPKGQGFLYIREGVEIEPLLHGGGQESTMRSGTENVAGIVGMAAALNEHVSTMDDDARRLEYLRDRLLYQLRNQNFIVNGAKAHIPGSLSLSFIGVEGEVLLHRLDLMGVSVATGSACNSEKTVLSHVIRSIGVPDEYATGTIRITLGMDNDEAQIDHIAECIKRIIT